MSRVIHNNIQTIITGVCCRPKEFPPLVPWEGSDDDNDDDNDDEGGDGDMGT